MRTMKILLLSAWIAAPSHAELLTLPLDERPAWLQQDGIVMAGSWEPLLFRVRRDGSNGYTPTPEQRAAYAREHTPEMIAELKSLGVNFVMMHCYKGFGPSAERESMADAVRFARLCHDEGLRVGVYVYSGAFGWELLFKEVPEAKDWVVLDEQGNPRTYGRATYRYYWNRNHPDAQAFYRKIVRFAVCEIGTDLLHFDNYVVGPGSDKNSAQRFRGYLQEGFTREQLAHMGITDLAAAKPPMTGPPDNFLRRAWLDFSCQSLSDSYHDMSRYARSLRKDILVECNPGGVGQRIVAPIDHGRLLQGGEAFWDEGRPPGYTDGKLQSRIRTYKVARRAKNMAFCYATNPLEVAESMAFNLGCLGCICWFEYGRIVEKPGSIEPVSKAITPFIHFFHTRRELLRDATVIADVAVLRSFPSQVFADPQFAALTDAAEQCLILNRIPFQVIYDHQLKELEPYRILILAGCIAMSDGQIERVREYARRGGRLCVIGPAATHDEWMLPRDRPALDDLPPKKKLVIAANEPLVDAIRALCEENLSLSVEAPEGVCVELTEQRERRLVHLVNYRPDKIAENVIVRMHLPPGKQAKSVTLESPDREKKVALPFEEQTDTVEFAVPGIEVYEIAVIAFE